MGSRSFERGAGDFVVEAIALGGGAPGLADGFFEGGDGLGLGCF